MQDHWMEAFAKWNAQTQMLFSCILLVAGFVLAILGCIFVHSLLRLFFDTLTALFWGWPTTAPVPVVGEEDEEDKEDEEDELLAEVKKTNELLAEHAKVFKKWLDVPDGLLPLVEKTNELLAAMVPPKSLLDKVHENMAMLSRNWNQIKEEWERDRVRGKAANAVCIDEKVETVEKEIELAMDLADTTDYKDK